jgi:hypothetical protein
MIANDGSVGWLVGNGGGMSRIGGDLPAAVTRDWFASPRTFIVFAAGAVGSAAVVSGGYRITGRWPFGSGAPYATHFLGLATVGGNQASDQPRLCFYLDRAQVTVHDTWRVSGLRGTGGSNFEARDTFVVAERVHPFIGLAPLDPGVLYRMPPLRGVFLSLSVGFQTISAWNRVSAQLLTSHLVAVLGR